MGNWWTGGSDFSEHRRLERELYEHSQVPMNHIQIEDVYLDFLPNTQNFIHTVTIISEKGPEAPLMVLIHGFGGGGAIFYKMIAGLRKDYNLKLIDLPGLGGSGRIVYTQRDF